MAPKGVGPKGAATGSPLLKAVNLVLFLVLIGIAFQAFNHPSSSARKPSGGEGNSHDLQADKRSSERSKKPVRDPDEIKNNVEETTAAAPDEEGIKRHSKESTTEEPSPSPNEEDVGAKRNSKELSRDDIIKATLSGLKRVEDALLIRQAATSNALRACFVSLTKHDETAMVKVGKLFRSLRDRIPSMTKKYPYVLFHEARGTESEMSALLLKDQLEGVEGQGRVKYPPMRGPVGPWRDMVAQHVFPAGVRFGALDEVDFGKIPKHIKPEHQKRWAYPSSSYWGIKYRHMCRFFGVRIFHQEVLHDFDYYMRLDTDSYILTSPMSYTPRYVTEAAEVLDHFNATHFPHPRQREIHFLSAAGRGGTGSNKKKHENNNNHHVHGEAHHDQGHEVDQVVDEDQQQHHRGVEDRLKEGDGEAGSPQDLDLFLHFAAGNPEYHTSDDHKSHLIRKDGGLLYHRHYGFVMLHPQDQAVFLTDLWETMERFIKHHNQGRIAGKDPEFVKPRSLFDGPRHKLIHYWDNFEIVNLRIFRDYTFRRGQPVGLFADPELLEQENPRGREEENHPQQADDEVGDDRKNNNNNGGDPQAGVNNVNGENAVESLVSRMSKEKQERQVEIIKSVLNRLISDHGAHAVLGEDPSGGQFATLLEAILERLKESGEEAETAHHHRKSAILAFLEYVEKAGGFYYNRWGDAEIRTLMVSLFLEPQEIAYFTSLPYQHYHNYHCPSRNRNFDVSEHFLPEMKRLAALTEDKCSREAKTDHGQGHKGRGSAPMDPAEREQWNTMFRKHEQEDQGWTPI